MRETLTTHELGDILARYLIDPATRVVGLELLPVSKQDSLNNPADHVTRRGFHRRAAG